MSKITGSGVLLGFSDFFGSDDEIGATKAHKKIAPKKAAGKAPARPYPKAKRSTVIEHHGKVLHKAHDTLLKAARGIGGAQVALAHKPVPPHAPKLSAAKLHGKMVSVGAVAAKKLSPQAMAAVAKHNAAVKKAVQAAKVLAQHAIATKKSVKTLAQKMVAQKKTAKLARTPLSKRGKVHVGELLNDPVIGEQVEEALLGYYESVGADPDPANPGLLTDGSPDPAFTGEDPTAGDPSLGPATDDTFDSGVTLPDAPPMSQFIADMASVGGIAYDGSKGMPNGYVGSYGLFTGATEVNEEPGARGSIDGTAHYGYVFGSFDQDNVPNGIPWGGRLQEGQWNKIFGRYKIGASGDFNSVVPAGEAFGSHDKKDPKSNAPYGPLVGNPGMPDFKAMRVDANGQMFWLPQEAPDWLLFPIKQAAALTAQQEAKTAAEQKKLDDAANAKAAADAAAAQAAQDAANALAESQAASDAKIAQGQAETQAQQTIVQQSQADIAQQAVDTDQQKQAGQVLLSQAQQEQAQNKQIDDMLIAKAKREEDYLAQHPDEEMVQQGDDEQGDDGDGSLDEGGDAEEASIEDDTNDAEESGDPRDLDPSFEDQE